jgi:hypothetical protein
MKHSRHSRAVITGQPRDVIHVTGIPYAIEIVRVDGNDVGVWIDDPTVIGGRTTTLDRLTGQEKPNHV